MMESHLSLRIKLQQHFYRCCSHYCSNLSYFDSLHGFPPKNDHTFDNYRLPASMHPFGIGLEDQEKGFHYYIYVVYILYNMFLFKRKESAKQSNTQVDKNMQRLTMFARSCSQRSNLKCYYSQICKSVQVKQQKFQSRYQKQISRIKKSEPIWNYSDISIVRNCLKKSMLSETLSVLVQRWCESMQIYVLQPLMDSISNKPTKKLSQHQKTQIIQQQIQIFCSLLFGFGFEMYSVFFYKHYMQKSKLDKTKQWTRTQIYQREKVVFEDFVRNSLTSLSDFSVIFHQYLMVIFKVGCYSGNNKEIGAQFQQFLSSQLKINQNYQKIYTQTSKSIWDFHTQTSLQQKLQKSTKIIPSIEQDHHNYFKSHNKIAPKKDETITTPLLQYLFKIYCPDVITSIKYIKMLICYRRTEEKYDDLLKEFCFLWGNQDQYLGVLVVLDCFGKDE